MAKKHTLGLVSIEVADIAGDGGIGTSWTAIGDTLPGSASFVTEEGTTTDLFAEESDTAIESIVSEPGGTYFDFTTQDLQADTLILLFGGTKSGIGPVVYSPPDTAQTIEKSIRVTDKKGNILAIVRGSVKPRINMTFTKTALGNIPVRVSVLTPTKANTKAWTFSTPTA